MLFGGSAFGSTPWASAGDTFAGVNSPLYEMLAQGTATEIVLLFEAQVRDRTTGIDIPVRASWTNARRPWYGSGDDTEAFPETLLQPALAQTLLFGGAPLSGESSEASSRFGAVVLRIDPQHALADELLWRLSWEGSPWTLKMGGPDDGYSTFTVVAAGEVSDASWDRDRISLQISEPDDALRQPIQSHRYTGTGALNGVEALKDRFKPLCYGRVYSQRPVLIDPANQVYQIHDGPVESIQIYDGGLEFSTAGPTNVADVYAWTQVAGTWVTDLAHGVFRIGNLPQFQLTFDAEGDATGGYVEQLADVCRRIVTQRTTLTANGLDGLLGLSIAAPYAVGLYSEDGSGTAAAALTSLLAPLGCYAVYRSNGLLFFDQLAPGGASLELEDHEITSVRRLRGTRAMTELRILYQRIGVVHDEGNLATGLALVDPERQAFLGREWREAIVTDTPYRRRARSATTETALVDSGDAAREATRQITLANEVADVVEVILGRAIFSLEPGQTIRITHPEQGFEAGREGMLIGVTPDVASGRTTLQVWM